jgi:hypothetical protein
MTLPYPIDPALPSNPNPFFNDNSFVRGSQFRSNNAQVWANDTYLNAAIPAAIDAIKFRDVQGFNISIVTSGDTAHDLDISPGICKSEDLVTWMGRNTTLTKQIDAAWAVGNNAGGHLNFSIPSATRASSGTTRTVSFQRKHGFSGIGAQANSITISGFANAAYNVTDVKIDSIVDEFTITYTGTGSLSESTTADTSGTVVGGSLSTSGLQTAVIYWFEIWGASVPEDVGFSRSAYEAALPAGYTKKRFIGVWLITGASPTLVDMSGNTSNGSQVLNSKTYATPFAFGTFTTSATPNAQTNNDLTSILFARYYSCFIEGIINGTNAAAWAVIANRADYTLPNPTSTTNTISGAAAGRDSSFFRWLIDSGCYTDFGNAKFATKGSIASVVGNYCINTITIKRSI